MRPSGAFVVLASLACGLAGACSMYGSDTATAPVDGGVDATTTEDANAPDPDGGKDAAGDVAADARCDAATPFGAPVFVSGIDVGAQELSATLTPDGLQIVFASSRALPSVTGNHLYAAARPSTSAAFGDAQALPGLLTTNVNDYWATSAPWTGTDLYFCSTRPNDTASSIFVTTYLAGAGTFAAPVQVASLVNDAQGLCYPHAARHAQEIWMGGSTANANVYRASRQASGGFATPVAVTELNTDQEDSLPVLSDDGLVVYWTSNRTDKTHGRADIWVATRSDPNGAFGDLRNVDELNSSGNDWPSWLSPDQCKIYLSSDRSESRYRLFVASRSP